MLKSDAIRLLGGSPTSAARLIGISASAVSLWPDDLPPRIADRVQAALWRRQQAEHEADIAIEHGDASGAVETQGQ